MPRDAPKYCPSCRREITDGPETRIHCSPLCRSRAFRERQKRMGRRRTRVGYRDGLSAWDARDRYGEPA